MEYRASYVMGPLHRPFWSSRLNYASWLIKLTETDQICLKWAGMHNVPINGPVLFRQGQLSWIASMGSGAPVYSVLGLKEIRVITLYSSYELSPLLIQHLRNVSGSSLMEHLMGAK